MRRTLVFFCFILVMGCADLGHESIVISEEDEIEIGREFHQQLLQDMPPYKGDPLVQHYIESLGQELAKHSHRPNLTYTFTVLDTDQVNAFAVMGGYVYVTKGLLKSAKSGAEVATVIGHELGHISARHGVKTLETYLVAAGLAQLFKDQKIKEIVATAIIVGAGLIFSQDQEYEADNLGLMYAYETGYNPWGMVDFFEYIAKLEGKPEPSDPIEEFFMELGERFSTHPPTEDRIETAKKILAQWGVDKDSQGLKWESQQSFENIKSLIQ